MPATKTFIGASVAAVMMTNLPLGNAIGSLSPHNDEFPPQTKSSIRSTQFGPRAVCRYSSGETGTDGWSELEIVADRKNGVITESIACPKTRYQDAFTAEFNLYTGYDGSAGKLDSLKYHTKHLDYRFMYTDPPDNTGSDPLRFIDKSTFAHTLDRLSEFEGYLKSNEHDMSKLGIVVDGMRDFCSLLKAAVKKIFDTFPNMCQTYSIIVDEAVDAAYNEGWKFDNRDTGKAIFSPSFARDECG